MKRVVCGTMLFCLTLNNAYGEEKSSVQSKDQFKLEEFNPWLTYGSWGVFALGAGLYFVPETESPRFPNNDVNAFDHAIYSQFKSDEQLGTFGSPLSFAIFPWMATPVAMTLFRDSEPVWKRKTFIAMNAYMFTIGMQQLVSKVVARERPDGSDYESFYSGHSANAFVTAGLIAADLLATRKGSGKYLAVIPYAVASGLAFSRVYENKHFATDVLTGAVIGSLTGHLHYSMGMEKSGVQMTLSPSISPQHSGFTINGQY